MIIKIRDFFIEFGETLLAIIKIVFLSKFTRNKFTLSFKKELVILGNGPSLKDLLDQNQQFLAGKSLLCVNYFCRTDEFTLLKPSIYVISSPEYFHSEEKEDFAIERSLTLLAIAEKTNWPMVFCVPALAKKQKHWQKEFLNHPHIQIYYFNNTPISGFNWFTNWAFNQNIGMPRPHNVLIPSIMLALKFGFKQIYLAGADHSWIQEVFVDEDNEVLLSQKHFYDKQAAKQENYRDMSVPQPMYIGGSANTRKLHEVLEKFYYTFRSYWVIRNFAAFKNIQIYNITENSYIDAFTRMKLK